MKNLKNLRELLSSYVSFDRLYNPVTGELYHVELTLLEDFLSEKSTWPYFKDLSPTVTAEEFSAVVIAEILHFFEFFPQVAKALLQLMKPYGNYGFVIPEEYYDVITLELTLAPELSKLKNFFTRTWKPSELPAKYLVYFMIFAKNPLLLERIVETMKLRAIVHDENFAFDLGTLDNREFAKKFTSHLRVLEENLEILKTIAKLTPQEVLSLSEKLDPKARIKEELQINSWEGIGLIVELAIRFRERRLLLCKRALQRLVILFQELSGIDYGYGYEFRPLSGFRAPGIEKDLVVLEKLGGIRFVPVAFSHHVAPGDNAEVIRARAGELLNKKEVLEILEWLLLEFGRLSSRELDVVLVAIKVLRSEKEISKEEAIRRIKQAVKKVDETRIEELLSKVRDFDANFAKVHA